MIFFGPNEFFFVNFHYKNGCKNEFQDNNEKSADSIIRSPKKSILEPMELTSPTPQPRS